MLHFSRMIMKSFTTVLTLGVLAGVGAVGYIGLKTGTSIVELLTENRRMREAITNLTEQRQIGYAKVLDQYTRDGQLYTRLLFVVTDPENPTRRLLEKEYEIRGDVVHFDALIVKFSDQVVMDGREKALYLWRRIYGEQDAPSEGQPIEPAGQQPARYENLLEGVSPANRELFWEEIWKLAEDRDRLAQAGVQAVYGTGLYKRLQPGLIYIFNLDADGTFYPETVPAL